MPQVSTFKEFVDQLKFLLVGNQLLLEFASIFWRDFWPNTSVVSCLGIQSTHDDSLVGCCVRRISIPFDEPCDLCLQVWVVPDTVHKFYRLFPI
jgi:hypothetical protein